MLCHNCSYILSGKENFCPNCGTMPYGQLKETENKKAEVKKEEIHITPDSYPPYTPAKPVTAAAQKVSAVDIFDEPVQMQEREEREERGVKNPAGKIFILLFLTCTLAVTAFGLADYFGITKTVSAFVHSLSQKEEAVTQVQAEAYRNETSIVEPDISYSETTAYILTGNGLTLRKGPSHSYAPLYNLTDLTMVQIYGGSMINRSWVYVYCPERDCYGWLDGSFLGDEPYGEATLYSENGEPMSYGGI